jgi:four helix bundle protein
MNNSLLQQKSYAFALRIVKLYAYISATKQEYVMSKQLLRSWTAIGALIREAEFWQSRADFVSKLSIALKEANETEYWISLLHDSWYLAQSEYESIHVDSVEMIKLLVSSVKTTKTKIL